MIERGQYLAFEKEKEIVTMKKLTVLADSEKFALHCPWF